MSMLLLSEQCLVQFSLPGRAQGTSPGSQGRQEAMGRVAGATTAWDE